MHENKLCGKGKKLRETEVVSYHSFPGEVLVLTVFIRHPVNDDHCYHFVSYFWDCSLKLPVVGQCLWETSRAPEEGLHTQH